MKDLVKYKIDDFLKCLGEEELRYINRMVVERLKLIHQAHSTVAMSQFSIGDSVKFRGNDGSEICGTILKLNKKTASVKVGDDGYWNVAPQFLERV